jgi:LemA protein
MVKQFYGLATSFLGMTLPTDTRRSEYILTPQTKVFAYGYVVKGDDGLVLHEQPQHPLIISQKTKEAYVEEFYKGRALVFLVHFLAAIGFSTSMVAIKYLLKLSPSLFLAMLVLGNSGILISIIFTMYNRLITLAQRAEFALNDIDIELKRRADLIPKIVELVKAYTEYEKELQGFIARARAHTVFLKDLPEGSGIDINPLVAIIENYPDLKASENFRGLMTSLVDTEERIVYARAFYNRTVRKLNTLVRQFPFIIISEIFNIKEMEYVSVVAEDRVTPEVNMTPPSVT